MQGKVVAASASGSQLGPYVSGAGKVIWVVGSQKIVPTLDDAMRRGQREARLINDGSCHKRQDRKEDQ
jgi:hypothetical protein